MFSKSVTTLVAAAVLATASFSAATGSANAGNGERIVAGAIAGLVIGAAIGSYNKHEAGYHGYGKKKHHGGYNKKRYGWKRCKTVPVYDYDRYGDLYIVDYEKVCR